MLALFAAFLLVAANVPLTAQTTRYFYNSNGDSLAYSWPPPDSAYVHDHVLLKFHPGALNLSMLCYSYTGVGYGMSDTTLLDTNIKMAVMGQRFYLDSGIVNDTTLLQELIGFGGTYLMRITSANPCVDTFSIARDGDTLAMDHFNLMVLAIQDTTRILGIVDSLARMPSGMVASASLDYIGTLFDRTPRDPEFGGAPQKSLDLIGVENPWSTQTGNRGIKIGIIDDGINWRHCDFGWGMSLGHKITGGWNFAENNPDITYDAEHGTAVAGILGAVTENENSGCVGPGQFEGIAGIAGGWWSEGKLGCQVMGFRIATRVPSASAVVKFTYQQATAAILEGAAYRPPLWDGTRIVPAYGYGVHILNNSWGFFIPSNILRNAINFAFEQRVSFVAARGNTASTVAEYPVMYDPQWVTAVSAGDRLKNRISYSSYGLTTDLLAPGGQEEGLDRIVRTTQFGGGYKWFFGTSAAAPHVSGVLGLLRSEALDRFSEGGWNLFPEDYEGMLKASAEDRDVTNLGQSVGYDDPTAWGHLRADNLFNMLNQGYVITRHSVTPTESNAGAWGLKSFVGTIHANSRRRYNTRHLEVQPGLYHIKVRPITVTFTLPDEFDLTTGEMFIWGINPRFLYGGWGMPGTGAPGYATNPEAFQTSYTRVMSGTGGNSMNEGIIHTHSRTVTVRTYQYQFFKFNWNDNTPVAVLPPINHCRMYISVFAKPKTGTRRANPDEGTSGIDDIAPDLIEAAQALSIHPNPSRGNVVVRYVSAAPGPVELLVTNQYGVVVTRKSRVDREAGAHTITLEMDQIATGVYICTVVSASGRMSRSFVVAQ